jgi:hypothetical protein
MALQLWSVYNCVNWDCAKNSLRFVVGKDRQLHRYTVKESQWMYMYMYMVETFIVNRL